MMITGFDNITYNLTDTELALVPDICKLFKKGSEYAINSSEIRRYILNSHNIELNGSRIRKLIHYIRVNKIVTNLIATSKGYYIAVNTNDVITYLKSLKERRNSIQRVIDSLHIEQQFTLNL